MRLSSLSAISFVLVSGLAQAEIKGKFQTDCASLPEENISLVRTVDFSPEVLMQEQIIYGDLQCQAPAYAFVLSGPYALAEGGLLDITMASIQLKPLDARIATGFTQAKLCGIEVWEVGKAQEVAGKNCGGSAMPAAGSMSYDRVQEVETGLVFGATTEETDGSTQEKRPVELDMSAVFKPVAPEMNTQR